MKDRWPWGKKVPVTAPNEAAVAADPVGNPAGGPDAVPAAQGEPVSINRPTTMTDLLSEPAATASKRNDPAQAQPAETVAPSPSPAGADRQPELVAASGLEVSGQIITIKQLLHAAEPQLSALPGGLPDSAFRNQARQIIEEEVQNEKNQLLVLAEAERRLTEKQKGQIEAELDLLYRNMLGEADGSPTKLQQDLERQGTTLEQVLQQERRALTIQTYLRSILTPAISINRRTLLNYYRQHRSEFAEPKKVQMQLIAVPFASFYPEEVVAASEAQIQQAKAQARQEIREAAKALRDGEDFGAVGKRLSRGPKAQDGGLWRPMPAGSFRETAVEQAAFRLQEGQASEVIETETGCYIVKVARVLAGQTIRFEDAQQKIENILREEQFRKLVDDYFERVRVNAAVTCSEKFLELAVERALEQYHRR